MKTYTHNQWIENQIGQKIHIIHRVESDRKKNTHTQWIENQIGKKYT